MDRENAAEVRQTFLLLAGRYVENNAFELIGSWETPFSAAVLNWKETRLHFEQLNEDGEALVATPAQRAPEADSDLAATWLVEAQIPLHPEARTLVLRDGDREIFRRRIPEQPPSVAIEGVEKVNEERARIRWTASTEEQGPLSYSLYYLLPDGRLWLIAVDLEELEASVDLGGLPGSDEGALGVVASDGLRSGWALSEPFSVAEKPPRVVISRPRQESTLEPDQLITLVGRVSDVTGQSLGAAGLVWRLDGEEVARDAINHLIPAPEPGPHKVELEYRSDGSEAFAAATFTVAERTADQKRLRWILDGRKGSEPPREKPETAET